MAIEFKYNKTSMQELGVNLKIRVTALPTLQSKESALRVEVKKYREKANELDARLVERLKSIEEMQQLWKEFDPSLVKIRDTSYAVRKIAGVQIPMLDKIEFDITQFNLHRKPVWLYDGIKILEELLHIQLERQANLKAAEILEYARKKTTQKVNLYEKVQIPDYQQAIQKIKRFLEDEENLSKAAQKILKKRLQAAS